LTCTNGRNYNTTVISSDYSEETEIMALSKPARVVAGIAGMTVMLLASTAMAQGAGVKETPAAAEGGGGEGYGYEFEDDPLAAGGFGPNDATIKVRPKAAHLLRARDAEVGRKHLVCARAPARPQQGCVRRSS
jgi:hypothetical protein